MKKLFTTSVAMICAMLIMTGCSIDPKKLTSFAIKAAASTIRNVNDGRSTRTNTPLFKTSRTTNDFRGSNDRYGWTTATSIPGLGTVPAIYGLQPCGPYGINAVVLPGHKTLARINSTRYPANKSQCLKYYGPSAKLTSRKWVATRIRIDNSGRRAGRNVDHTWKHDIAKSQGLLPLFYRGYPGRGGKYYAETIEYLQEHNMYADMP